jgi:Septum formation
METVRGILAAHRLGISRPGLLAWARLRIDTAMTEAQLEEELARLGDEVVDIDGFLYLREYVGPSRQPARTAVPPRRASPAPAPTTAGGRLPPDLWAWRRDSPGDAGGRGPIGRGGIGTVIGVGVFLWWLVSFVGGFVNSGNGAALEPTALPSPTAAARPLRMPTPSIGDVVPWRAIGVGDCIVLPEEARVGELRRVPCDTRHGGEVFALVDHPGPLEAFPDDGFAAFVAERCGPAFRAWTGTEFPDQDVLEMAWFSPTWEGWVGGDRQITCYLVQADGTDMYSSYRAAGP